MLKKLNLNIILDFYLLLSIVDTLVIWFWGGGGYSSMYINKINEQNKLLSRDEIKLSDYDNMFINNRYIILNKRLENNIYLREIYDVNIGSFESSITDTIKDDCTFERVYKETSLVIQNNKAVNITVSKILPTIKSFFKLGYSEKDNLVSNPFIGTFDLEVYRNTNDLGKVYAAGFCVLNKDPILFYLNKNDVNNKDILLECLNSMLRSEYDGYTFYVHNLSYDGVFILHKLKYINFQKGYEYYKIHSLFRDNSLLKIEISVDRVLSGRKQAVIGARKKPKDIKITFIDSFNILSQKLSKLCEAFDVETTKGNFPYDFVNENTLNYIGETPSLKY